MNILLLFAASIVLASTKLTLYHGRDFYGGYTPRLEVQQVQGVATLALGSSSCCIDQFFDCNSTTGSNLISNLVWEKEGGSIRFEVNTKNNAKRLDLAAPNGGMAVLGQQDEGIYTCRDIVTRESVSLKTTGSNLAVSPTDPMPKAIMGTNVSLMVYVAGYPPVMGAEIEWHGPGNVRILNSPAPSRWMLVEGNKRLLIQNVRVGDSGTYRINLRRHVFSTNFLVVTTTIELNVLVVPTVESNPSSVMVLEHDHVTFTCNISGNPAPLIMWERDSGNMLPVVTRTMMTSVPSTTNNYVKIVTVVSEYTIRGVLLKDMGDYRCSARNSASTTAVRTTFATLSVTHPPRVTITHQGTPPTSINQLIEVTAEGGDPAPIFFCSSDGYPPPDLSWVGHASGGRFSNGVTQKRQGTDQILVWSRKLVYTDSGFYNCTAQNREGSSTVTLNLLVKRSPTITSIYSSFTSPISSSSTSSFLVHLNYSGNILTCSGYGWPPPSIEWVREGQSLTGRMSASGQNQAFVSARLTLREGERFGQSHVGDYSCIIWSGDGTNQTYKKVVTLTSSTSVGATPTPLPTCTSESLQENFQIRILHTECNNWEDSLKERIASDFKNEMLNIISTECQNCSVTPASVTIFDMPICSSELQGDAVFRGSISTGGADTTEDMFCTLDAWYRAGPLLQVNNKLHLVDQNCTLKLDVSSDMECTVPSATSKDSTTLIAGTVVVGALFIMMVIMCIFVGAYIHNFHAKKNATIIIEITENDSSTHARSTGPDVMMMENKAYETSAEAARQVGEERHLARSSDSGPNVRTMENIDYGTSVEAGRQVGVERHLARSSDSGPNVRTMENIAYGTSAEAGRQGGVERHLVRSSDSGPNVRTMENIAYGTSAEAGRQVGVERHLAMSSDSGPNVRTMENIAYGTSAEAGRQVGVERHLAMSSDSGPNVRTMENIAYGTSAETTRQVGVET